jgi:2-dehydropantoate 2-reductase
VIETSVLVVGAGAIGGVTAAKMTGEVDRVAVLDANDEHVERMRGDGLLLEADRGLVAPALPLVPIHPTS